MTYNFKEIDGVKYWKFDHEKIAKRDWVSILLFAAFVALIVIGIAFGGMDDAALYRN